jgi:hypothetical protein
MLVSWNAIVNLLLEPQAFSQILAKKFAKACILEIYETVHMYIVYYETVKQH